MNRRQFAVAIATAATGPWTARASSAQPARRLLRPPRLARGNVVGLVAPSGVTNDSEIERATRT
ncbi:MAG: LD-carboxypeptidase, partial [Betaproteobacteria bacterium]|nr:LD-carboxypeptidase [Betaproteobacteria bacterium]